jgi:hypothetical protein
MSTARDRQRACRSRQAAGKIWVPTEIDEIVWVIELVDAGFLDRGAEEDRGCTQPIFDARGCAEAIRGLPPMQQARHRPFSGAYLFSGSGGRAC